MINRIILFLIILFTLSSCDSRYNELETIDKYAGGIVMYREEISYGNAGRDYKELGLLIKMDTTLTWVKVPYVDGIRYDLNDTIK